jgi:hypothetical protein
MLRTNHRYVALGERPEELAPVSKLALTDDEQKEILHFLSSETAVRHKSVM